ncbi:MAG: hypothetical protein FJX77_10080, partial [Armatimonadetes bacterium]|nr:hypothetical protein [Armatimonadota bacterium]
MRRWSFWKAGEEPDDPAGSSASEPVEEEGSPLAVTGERLARSARTLFARVSEALARTDEDHGESGLVSESEPV